MDLKESIRGTTVIVRDGRYAYLKASHRPQSHYFMISKDASEVTVIAHEEDLEHLAYSSSEKWFKLIEFRMLAPFKIVGFLAAITNAIAAEELNVLVVSTFSKDYILVRDEHFEDAKKSLQKIGFNFK